MICGRCLKNTDGVHTCTPSSWARAKEEELASAWATNRAIDRARMEYRAKLDALRAGIKLISAEIPKTMGEFDLNLLKQDLDNLLAGNKLEPK